MYEHRYLEIAGKLRLTRGLNVFVTASQYSLETGEEVIKNLSNKYNPEGTPTMFRKIAQSTRRLVKWIAPSLNITATEQIFVSNKQYCQAMAISIKDNNISYL